MIPTEADWGQLEAGDLDARYARRMFAGKSFQDAVPMFRANVLERAEDLHYMPPVPFRFYMLAFKEYVLSDAVLEDELAAASAADSFLSLVESRLREHPGSISPIIDELMPAVTFVAQNQDRYGATLEIYGDFRDRMERINELRGA